MTTHDEQRTATPPAPTPTLSLFRHVLVGIDGTAPSFEACRQVARLAEPDTAVDLVAVVHLAEAVHAGMDAPHVADELEREAEQALVEAQRIFEGRAVARSLNGFATATLHHEVERRGATLLALGSHGHRRLTEILIGGVAGELLHLAPCSVLIARPAADADAFPRAIVVGFDGSDSALAAVDEAAALAARMGSELRVVAARRGKHIDEGAIRSARPDAAVVDLHPVEALVAASSAADLVVVGSRGLHGPRALGSVSERVAHQARCSVLVVRARNPA
jgi:nucleotide-binding universal stress UspA family protein